MNNDKTNDNTNAASAETSSQSSVKSKKLAILTEILDDLNETLAEAEHKNSRSVPSVESAEPAEPVVTADSATPIVEELFDIIDSKPPVETPAHADSSHIDTPAVVENSRTDAPAHAESSQADAPASDNTAQVKVSAPAKTAHKPTLDDDPLRVVFDLAEKETEFSLESEFDIDRSKKKKEHVPNNKRYTNGKQISAVSSKEFTEFEQADPIFKNYQLLYVGSLLRLIGSIALFIFMIYLETAPYLKFPLPYILDINFYNLVYIWVDLQALFLIAALNLKPLTRGFTSIPEGGATLDTLGAFFFAAGVIHTCATLLLRQNSPDIMMFNSIAGLALVLASLRTFLSLNAEVNAFKVASSKKMKFAISTVTQKDKSTATLPELAMFGDIYKDSQSVGRIVKTNFFSKFFEITEKHRDAGSFTGLIIYGALLLALVVFGVLLFLKYEIYDAGTIAIMVFFGTAPVSTYIVRALPVYHAQNKIHASGSAYIGETNIENDDEPAILSLFDRDIFPPQLVKVAGVRVYGKSRIDAVYRHLYVLANKLALPSAEVLWHTVKPDKLLHTDDINILSLDDNGILFMTEGKKLYYGTAEYIANIGLTVPFDENTDPHFLKTFGRIVYLSTETEVVAKILFRYDLRSDFYDIIKNIASLHLCLAVRTFDPSVTTELIHGTGNAKDYPVRVQKPKNSNDVYATLDDTSACERVEAVVSKGTLKSFVSALSLMHITKGKIKGNIAMSIAELALGAAGAVSMVFVFPEFQIHAGILAVLHLIWLLPMAFVSLLDK
ncbi:hypothetical protein FACS1894105_00300 [Clostridia bacterium]|nr:hypothetical protein FACS1894105_00300 [Clostridia bacterium]